MIKENSNMLEMIKITKRYPGVVALNKVDFTMKYGEIHGLVGKNGAGKSTLIKILSGAIRDFEGNIYINGEEANLSDPGYSYGKGISTVYQEFSLISELSVAENIYLGRFPNKKKLGINILDRNRLYKKVREQFSRLGVDINSRTIVSSLSVSKKQLVEIAKAISVEPKILLLDEPTSALSKDEAEHLFEVIKKLAKSGVSILYVSHRMDEIEKIVDRLTILRNGKKVVTHDKKEFSSKNIVKLMIGKELKQEIEKRKKIITKEPVLKVKKLNRPGLLEGISFQLNKGEILGLAGLMGSGRTELARCLFGLDTFASGEVEINGQLIKNPSPSLMKKLRVGFSPEDRKKQGLIPTMSIKHNLSIAILNVLTNIGVVKKRKEKKVVRNMIEKLKIKVSALNDLITSLSGGNQQKVVIGRWVAIDPQILILDEPTQGIDVEAKLQIYRILKELSKNGVSIILISSEMEEIVRVVDRVLVMRKGSIVSELLNDEINLEKIMSSAMGVPAENAN